MKRIRQAVVLFLVLSLTCPAFAQETKRDISYLQNQEFTEKAVGKLAKKSEAKEKVEAAEALSYQDILNQPDNIDLNYRFAIEQIKKNDLLAAASALERILMINPNLQQVRLLYGVVLYRLDNMEEAKQALEILKDQEMPEKTRSELNAYLRMIKLRQRKTKFAIRQSVGWGFDSNRNASPSSKQRLFANTTVDVPFYDRRKSDTHFLNATTIDVTQDLGFQAGHQVFGSFTYFLQQQNQVKNLNLQSFQYELGTALKSRFLNFTPSFYANHIFLSDQNFLRSQGGNFQFDRNFWGKLDLFTNVSVERQDFMNIHENTSNRNRKGVQTWLHAGASYLLTPAMRFTWDTGYGHKTAKQKYNAYDSLYLRGLHSWLLGKGQFLLNSLTYQRDLYQAAETAIVGERRKDNSMIYQVTYGAPLTFFVIGKYLPDPFQDITLSVSYMYLRSLSSITNYTFTNHQVQGLITKRLEF